ncbi:50S ribosomal protein L23 [Candidatus Marinimicrobia bacterium]|jgi:large subunit ribosomal protein L23|nr:50S ribosomal protein L23 [Candidatus Neomarinimicrobiota bacterium]|tara:strand:- start:350 stop:664 length:315 start_codon:yes stop_codon:yes gene_type:complete
MDYTDIIIKPLLSEKVNKLTEFAKQYVFQVSTKANKLQIKSAVEEKFEVKVKKVRTINCKGKMKNTSMRSNGKVLRTSGFRSDWKKAIITLSEGHKIDIVGGEI